jgi:cytidylate kinase
MKKITIAIDGFSSTGKSTLARDMAADLGYVYIDSGAMYRAVALYAMEHGLISNGVPLEHGIYDHLNRIEISFSYNPERQASDVFLNGRNVESDIRRMEISQVVSKISALGPVREKLVKIQKELGKERAVVMDGRDIGTVVFPDAELKIFMQADDEIRARRRFEDLQSKGMPARIEEIRQNLKHRDEIDMTREISPLRRAEDARILDNSSLDHQEQLQIALRWAKEAISNDS